jgi:hypothetical protein
VSDEPPQYRWTWLLLILFIFGCVLAVLWMLAEVKRVKHIRENSAPAPTATTNRVQ